MSTMTQEGRVATMSNPTAKLFQQVIVTVDVWVDPTKTDAALDAVLDNVDISIRNACDGVAKELELPDQGIEVMVR
jgi:hypothetical protein